MRYDFIEIGTSDFRTLIQTCGSNARGLSIDPLKFYLDRLPEKENVTKVNVGISDRNSKTIVYWVTPDNIVKHNLPNWIRGCNSIDKPHPTVLSELSKKGISTDIINKDEIELITFDTLIKKYKIEGVDFLKIDTEGHDITIIKSLLSSDNLILPKKIEFEANILSNQNEVNDIIEILNRHGYVITKRTESDIVVERKINKESRIYNISSFNRKDSLLRTIDSIFNQSDIINVSLNSYSEIPPELKDNKIRIILTNNELGDAYKFYNINRCDGYYFTIDDDIIYPKNYTDFMIDKYNKHKGKIITLHGRNFKDGNISSYYKSASERYYCMGDVFNDVKVMFGGTGVMLTHTDILRGLNIEYFKSPNMADVWVGKWAYDNKVDIICVEHESNWLKYQEVNDTIYDTESRNDKIQTEIARSLFN